MIICYIDSKGYKRVNPNDVHPLIAAYLEQDVQSSSRACDELIRILEDVKDGRRREWSGTGNAHTVTIRSDVVVIHNEWDDSLGDAHLPHDVFRGCIETWKACISS